MSSPQLNTEASEQLLSFEDECVTIVFDNDNGKKNWLVHRKPLSKSPFFRTALKSTWIEGETKVIKLLDDDPEVIKYYIHWLYASALPRTLYIVLAKLFVLGEKFLDWKFKNAVVLAIIRETDADNLYPVNEAVDTIYEGTMKGSLARRLLVDLFYIHGTLDWFKDHEYHEDFVLDLAKKRLAVNCGADQIDRHIKADNYLEVAEKEIADGIELFDSRHASTSGVGPSSIDLSAILASIGANDFHYP